MEFTTMEASLSEKLVLPASRNDLIDAAINSALSENRIVGTVVLVAENGKLTYQRAAGFADREAARLVALDTPFRFASVTKPFTVMAALKLIEQGRLEPDGLVAKHLPDFQPRLADGSVAEITVAQLMTHTAGLDYRFQQPGNGSYARSAILDGLEEGQGTLAENLKRIASVPLDLKPGSTWRYSVATDVLGAVIEAVAGQPLDRTVQALVIDPLKLGARFHWQSDDLAAAYYDAAPRPARMTGPVDVPLAYVNGPGIRFDPDRIRRTSAWPSGGAGMAGRASDVLTLLEAFRTGDFLSVDLREAARTSWIKVDEAAMGPGWGFSWFGAVLTDPAAIGSGWSKGTVNWGGVYGNTWNVDFERKRTVVALTNTAYEGLFGQFAQDISKAAAL
jgi:CubicO group peptidase (beta-lactamase class C family)